VLSEDEVEAEFVAQVERLIALEIYPDHIDSHESLLKYPFFGGVMKRVAKSSGLWRSELIARESSITLVY